MEPDPPLTPDQEAWVKGLPAAQIEQIDRSLLQNVLAQWRKVAMVVGMTMNDLSVRLLGHYASWQIEEVRSKPKGSAVTTIHEQGSKSFMARSSSRAFVITSLALLVSLGGCDRYALDREMEALCKKDGGVKVYETVTLSGFESEELVKYATAKNREDYFGPEYRLVEEYRILVGAPTDPEKGRGRIDRFYEAIYRRSDGRLLGESVSYGRVGGDGMTFGFQPSDNYCPKPRVSLQASVFLKGD